MINKNEINVKTYPSFHERFTNYLKVRNKIFKTDFKPTSKFSRLQNFRSRCKIKLACKQEIHSIGNEIDFSDRRPFGIVKIENVEIKGLLDSGATISVLGHNSLSFLDSIGKKYIPFSSTVSTSDGTENRIIGIIYLNVFYKNIEKSHKFYVVPSLSKELYLGVDFWEAFQVAPELFPKHYVSEIDFHSDIPVEPSLNDQHQLSPEQVSRLEKIKSLFPSSVDLGLGRTSFLKHKIDTGDAEPVKSRFYPVSPKVQELMNEELDRMISLGVIEESESPWNSPVVLVRKPGKNRLCLDSRKLNSVTKKMAYGLPNINGLISRLSDTYFISSIDLKDAFWQVELDNASKEKTAFTVPGRPQYQYRVMPFGLCNAAQRLCQLMDKVFPSHMHSNVFVYLDDLLIVSTNFDDHMTLLADVARKLRLAGLTVNLQKSRFCFREVKYLGHIVGYGTIRPDPEKVSAIENFPIPCSVKQVRRFVGMVGYYGKFLKNFSALSSPLTDLIKKKGKFLMTPEARESFVKLKKALISEPILVHPDFTKPFFIHCDASRYGIGACLMQKDVEGNDRAICYFSKKLNNAQRNYSVTELECLAAVLAVEKFRSYVELHQFTIITDHSALKWLMSQKDLNGRLARWSLRLQRFDFSIQHRKGRLNVVPDTLSRENDVSSLCNNMPLVDLQSPSFDSEEYDGLRKIVRDNSERLPDIKLSENYVYKRVGLRVGDGDDTNLWRLWIPTQLTHDLIAKTHTCDDTLHGGIKKTCHKLRQLYFWPKLHSQVVEYTRQCETCKSAKRPNSILQTPMGKPFESDRPFQLIYMDYLGPYPRSHQGNSYMLVVLDHLTKYPIFIPLKQATAILTIGALEKLVFSMFNVPESVFTDNGAQFLSRTFQDFLSSYGIKHLKTPIYSAQANASERLNQSIIQGIRLQISNEHKRWDECLTQIGFALRSTIHESIGMSPHKALFGQEMVCHGSAYKLLRKLDCLGETDINITRDTDKIRKLQDDLQNKIRQSHEKNEKKYNLRVRKAKWVVGQEVYRRLFHQSDFGKQFNAKFAPKFEKCRVKEVLADNRLVLENLKGKVIGTYHSKDVKQ